MAEQLNILVVSGRHAFAGTIDHRNLRVLDVLNDVNLNHIQLRNVTVYRDLQTEQVSSISEATVAKAEIDFVMLTDKRHEAPLRRQYALVEKRPYAVCVALAEYVIRGALMIQGRPDPLLILGRDMPVFFPITGASVSSVEKIDAPIPATAVLVNRARVSLVFIEGCRSNLA